ncbi:MAG: YceI family protein [Bacteroidota bacterium]
MNRFIKTLCLLLLLTQSSLGLAQEIDLAKSSIDFVVTNLGLDVEGKFRRFSGTINFSPDKLEESSFEISIPVKSIFTDNSTRDEHLQEEEFFHAASHPNITFSAKEVKKSGEQYILNGSLTIKGTSKQISIPFTYENATFSGEITIDRQDFSVGGSGFLDTIGDEVIIKINCVLKADE